MATCGECPDAVIFTLRDTVQQELFKVRSIIDLAPRVSDALANVATLAIDTVDQALGLVPALPILDFAEILSYLTCPLTPLALLVDFEQFASILDPTVQLQRLKSLATASLNAARRAYEDFLTDSEFAQVIGLARRFANEFVRISFNPISFARAIVISASVLTLCGEEEYTNGPYLEFANTIQGFSLVGGLPTSMDQNVAALIQRLLEGEARFRLAAQALV